MPIITTSKGILSSERRGNKMEKIKAGKDKKMIDKIFNELFLKELNRMEAERIPEDW